MTFSNTYIQLISTSGDTGVNGYIYLTEGISVPVSYEIANIQDIATKNSSYSKPVKIPGSKENNIMFGNIFKINTTDWTFDINIKQKMILVQNGVVVLRGYMKLNGVTKKSPTGIQGDQEIFYDIVLFEDRTSFYDDLGDSLLEQLDYSQYNHTYNNFYTQETTGNTWEHAYVYPMQYNPSAVNYKTKNFLPAIFVKSYWNKIFQTHGYSYECTTVDTDQFEAQIIPFNGEPKLSEEAREQRMFQASVSGDVLYQATRVANTNGYTSDNLSTADWYYVENYALFGPTVFSGFGRTVNYNNDSTLPNFDSGSTYDTTLYTFTSPANGTYDFDIAFRGLFTWSAVSDGWLYPNSADPSLSAGTALPFYVRLVKNKSGVTTKPQLETNTVAWWYDDSSVKIPQRGNITTSGPDISAGQEYQKTFDFAGTAQSVYLAAGDTVQVMFFTDANRLIDATTYWDTSGHVGQATNDDNVAVGLEFLFTSNVGVMNRFKNIPHIANIDNGDEVILSDFIPKNIKQKDFISSIIKLNNFYITTDEDNDRKLIIRTRDEFYDTNEYVDWTDKWQRRDESEVKFLSDLTNRRLILRYKDDSDSFNKYYKDTTGINYGAKYLDFENQFLQGDKVIEPIFSPTPIVRNAFGLDVPAIDSMVPKNNIRILYYNGMKEGSWTYQGDFLVSQSKGYYPQASHFYPGNDDIQYDLNFSENDYYFIPLDETYTNNLYNQHYAKTVNQLANGKLFTGWFNLNEYDIKKLDFRKKVWLLDSYYYLNRVVDYDANAQSLTKVELIKADEGLRNRPRRRKGDTAYKPQGELIDEIYNQGGGTSGTQGGSSTILQEAKGDNTINTDGGGAVLGTGNEVRQSSGFIVQGDDNTLLGANKSTVLGSGNKVMGGPSGAFIIGDSNEVYGLTTGATIINGSNNVIDGKVTGVTIIGSSNITITAQTEADAVYVGGVKISNGVISNATISGATVDGYLPLSGGQMTSGAFLSTDSSLAASGNFAWGTSNSGTSLSSSVLGGSYNIASNNAAAVVGGTYNQATGVQSFIGGGYQGLASGDYSSVIGGTSNTASGYGSVVAGGVGNTASGNYSFVTAGYTNTASGVKASVIGGSANISSGDSSVVLGGATNKAGGNRSTIIGGATNRVSGAESSIIGGISNFVSADRTVVLGGQDITGSTADAVYTPNAYLAHTTGSKIYSAGTALEDIFITAGLNTLFSSSTGSNSIIANNSAGNIAEGNYSQVLGGVFNKSVLEGATVVSGVQNTAYGQYCLIFGGSYNSALTINSVVVSGTLNKANANFSFIGAGNNNETNATYAFVGAGSGNKANALNSFVGAGSGNTTSGLRSAILNGSGNTTSGIDSVIIGGFGNSVTGNQSAIIGGSLITGTSNSTVYVPNLEVRTNMVVSGTTDLTGTVAAKGALNVSGATSLASTVIVGDTLSANGGIRFETSGGTDIWKFKSLNIVDWDMDTTASKAVMHGLSATEWLTIRNVDVMIINDAQTNIYPLLLGEVGVSSGYHNGINSTQISVGRVTGGGFDNTSFDSTGGFVRGYISFWYIPD